MTTVTAPADSVLRNPRHRVNPKAKLWWAAHAAISWLVFVGAQLAIWLTNSYPSWLLITMLSSAGIAVLHVTVMPLWRYRVHRWEASAAAVYTLTGWFTTEWRVAPLSRIQTVDTKRGALERLFKLATVTVTTASAAGPVRISGLDADDAAELVDHLTASTQATPGDAT